MCVRGSHTRRVLVPTPLGMHNGQVLGLRWAPRGSGAAHGSLYDTAELTFTTKRIKQVHYRRAEGPHMGT